MSVRGQSRAARSSVRRTLPASSRSGWSTYSNVRGSLYRASRSARNASSSAVGITDSSASHDGVDDVAAVLVGKADDGTRMHRGVFVDRRLDLGRVDVRAAGQDHVLHADHRGRGSRPASNQPMSPSDSQPPSSVFALGADVAVGRCRLGPMRIHTSPFSPVGSSLPSSSQIFISPVLTPTDRTAVLEPLGAGDDRDRLRLGAARTAR